MSGGINSIMAGAGNDTINAFEDGIDLLDLSGTGLVFADLTITNNGGDTLIIDGAGNETTLVNTLAADITVDDFIF